MKKIKLLIPFLSIFIFCGCKAEIDLVVDTKLNIEENIQVSMPKAYINGYFSSLDEVKENYVSLLNQYDNKYSLDIFYQKEEVVGKIKKSNNLKEHSLGMESLLFKNINEVGQRYEFVFSDDVKNYFDPELEIDVEEEAILDQVELNIQFHNVISDNNSDSYNSVTNTYTWIIDEDNLDRNIEFTITNEKRYDIIIPYLLKKYIGYVFIGIFLIAIVIFVLMVAYKSKRENEI